MSKENSSLMKHAEACVSELATTDKCAPIPICAFSRRHLVSIVNAHMQAHTSEIVAWSTAGLEQRVRELETLVDELAYSTFYAGEDNPVSYSCRKCEAEADVGYPIEHKDGCSIARKATNGN